MTTLFPSPLRCSYLPLFYVASWVVIITLPLLSLWSKLIVIPFFFLVLQIQGSIDLRVVLKRLLDARYHRPSMVGY